MSGRIADRYFFVSAGLGFDVELSGFTDNRARAGHASNRSRRFSGISQNSLSISEGSTLSRWLSRSMRRPDSLAACWPGSL